MSSSVISSSSWFETQKVNDWLYLTKENNFICGNRCNIWLIKGPAKDVIIDCGLGVCNLRTHLENLGLIERSGNERTSVVICTHVHFDHSGGAHHFDNVFIHERDRNGLLFGRQTETLNYVKPSHFFQSPTPDFDAGKYKVPPTVCNSLKDGDVIDIGAGESLEILHVPGHTKGSIAIFYKEKKALFTGDFVYNTGYGGNLMDWLPTSSVSEYINSAETMIDWLSNQQEYVVNVYPGHFDTIGVSCMEKMLSEYVISREDCGRRSCSKCLTLASCMYIGLGCFRCCPD